MGWWNKGIPKKAGKVKLVSYEDDIFTGMVGEGLTDEEPVKGEFLKIKVKMPMSIWAQQLRFFDYCQRESQGMEGFLVIMLRKAIWSNGCPKQWNTPVSVDAHPELDPEEFHDVVGDIHSHPGMSSFHSSIDDADEKKHKHGMFLVAGSDPDHGFSLMTSQITIYAYARGRKFDLDPREVFDFSTAPGDGAFPDSWKKRAQFNRKTYMHYLKEEKEEAKRKATGTMGGLGRPSEFEVSPEDVKRMSENEGRLFRGSSFEGDLH